MRKYMKFVAVWIGGCAAPMLAALLVHPYLFGLIFPLMGYVAYNLLTRKREQCGRIFVRDIGEEPMPEPIDCKVCGGRAV